MKKRTAPSKFFLLLVLGLLPAPLANAFSSIRSSVFVGQTVDNCRNAEPSSPFFRRTAVIEMRKQKASDRRTRRRQRGQDLEETFKPNSSLTTLTTSPMRGSTWAQKTTSVRMPEARAATGGGRQRSRKRSTLYNALAFYHNTFLNQLTAEYQAEEEEVIGRIKASMDDPLGLETSGFALFDMYAERRGNLFGDAVYRLTKAKDATTNYPRNNIDTEINDDDDDTTNQSETDASTKGARYLPPNHKFSTNDVIMLTLQRAGSGDFFSSDSMPIGETAITAEARVLNMGPTYLDIVLPEGSFEGAFGSAPNDRVMLHEAKKNFNLRLRVDRFFSSVPYQRMVSALAALTTIPDRSSTKPKATLQGGDDKEEESERPAHSNICMDELLRELIISTYSFANPNSPSLGDRDACDIQELANRLAKPPMASSHKLANQVLKYIKSNTHGIFREFNAPQLAAIEAALTRRMTMIQGPPGTGKTTVSSAIAFGFVHQCRSLSPHTKVLACAFSNVGADNLAEAISKVGLKVVRIGKPSAVSESLWDMTLDAAIDRDPEAQKALKKAAKATAQLAALNRQKKGSTTNVSERSVREMATAAVKASIHACNLAATAALREADVVVTTSTGAADARLLAACGIVTKQDGDNESKSKVYDKNAEKSNIPLRQDAPDGLPPLSLPFVIIDEACQSVEPATLVPILSSNSCRSLVLLGDPCQLPPTVKSREAQGLSVSLMERLAALLPHPSVSTQPDTVVKDNSYLVSLPVKQAKSLLRSRGKSSEQASYRKRFSGSLLLSIQYRMHPSIAALPSAIFYDGLLSTPDFMASQRSFPSFWKKAMPSADHELGVRLINVGGRSNERQGMPSRFTRTVFGSSVKSSALEDQTTYWNEPEAQRVVSLIKDVLRDANREVTSIGVVTPYNGQVQLIKSMIASDGNLRKMVAANPASIEVKSVDGYQGRERDVIIFSAVRSNRQARIGFLHDWRRLNVALTRAKNAIVVVGDLDTLTEADEHWDALVKWASGVRCILDDFDSIDDEPSH